MRIGIDIRSLRSTVGGVRSYTMCLSSALAELGHCVKLLSDSPYASEDSRLENVCLRPQIGPIKFRGLWEKTILPLMAKCSDLDVLHFPADVGVPALRTCSYVATIHDVFPLVMPNLFTGNQLKRLENELSATANRCNAFITDSQQSKNDIMRHLGLVDQAISVVPLAPRDCFYSLSPDEHSEAEHSWAGLPKQFLLCVGGKNNRYHKNTHRVVEALSRVVSKPALSEVGLVVVGRDSEYMQEVRDLGVKLGVGDRITFTGIIDDEQLRMLYNLASVFVFPSLYEGFGLPILEAMACGAPVVTSNFGAMQEVAGDGGVLVDPEDAPAMADAIVSLLTDADYRAEVSVKGLAHGASFTWMRTAKETLQVYQSALGRPGN